MIEFEFACKEDAPVLAKIQKLTFEADALAHIGAVDGPTGYDSVQWQLDKMAEFFYYKIICNSNIVGGMIIVNKGEAVFELRRIFVVPDFQNLKIGQRAMEFMHSAFSTAEKWQIDTPEWAKRNHYLYEKMGYKRTGTCDSNKGFLLYEYERMIEVGSMNSNLIQKEWNATIKAFVEFSKAENITIIAQVSQVIADAFSRGNKAMIAGNGGSACDAIHFAEEFTGRFRKDRRALPVISFADPAHITCVGNDYGFDDIFSRDIEAFGVAGDVFVAISTSGNSPNIIKAVQAAKARGIIVVTLLGKSGGALRGAGDYELIVAGETSDKIQEVHMAILHIIIAGVEAIMFGMK